MEPGNDHPGLEIVERWALDPEDLVARATVARLDKLWALWRPEEKRILLDAVERIARALYSESAPSKVAKLEANQVGLMVVAAARLCTRLSELTAQMETVPTPKLSELRTALATFVDGASCALSDDKRALDLRIGHRWLHLLGRELGAGTAKPSNELVAQLVWLASGQPGDAPVDESTIRRLGSTKSLPLAKPALTRNWAAICAVTRFSDRGRSDALEAELALLLNHSPAHTSEMPSAIEQTATTEVQDQKPDSA